MNRSILIGAVIISGSILLNGYFDRKAEDPRPSKSEIRASVTETLEWAFHTLEGENVLMGETRDVEKVTVGDIRYSAGDERLLVDFDVQCADGSEISASVALERDDFWVYRGKWEFGGKRAHFEIKKTV